ncbi:toll/interleukin-1 receptor domain-containing protein [Saccharothrix australiensis]|uniref:TIR domain-containing protein n=1 Tax=Saccharothrix australiensis TaxID=2072 RepID=A0A495VUG5_9PSEU|nr:toll/interleukin-1 receptor domain-containing protein [Saccharothrix australiensis]RKT52824.1 TIR domain-containing protein [Saccharothrix australiensis]
MSGYQFDLFISYPRRGTVRQWLVNHFQHKLRECLADQIAPTPKIYVDKDMPRGVHWPSSLRHALRHSKIMIQLLTPQYFWSDWCRAEWYHMLAREKMLGLASLEKPQGLVYPILYADSDNFPPEGKERGWYDFKEFAYPDPGYQQTHEFIRFHREVTRLAADLAALLQQVPPWRPDWPDVDPPDPVLRPTPPLPRF